MTIRGFIARKIYPERSLSYLVFLGLFQISRASTTSTSLCSLFLLNLDGAPVSVVRSHLSPARGINRSPQPPLHAVAVVVASTLITFYPIAGVCTYDP